MTAEHKLNRQGHRYIYYRCTRKKSGWNCRQKAVEGTQVERQMVAFLNSITIPKRLVDWALTVIRDLDGEEGEKAQQTFET